jgi:putative transcription antitermination factor YqgF
MSQFLKNKNNILGVDYGDVNTGFAVSTDGVSAPLKIVNSKNFFHLLQEMQKVIQVYDIKLIVFGLPDSFDNKDTKQSVKVRQVVNNLKKYIKIPFDYISEYGTTSEALANGIISNMSRKNRNKRNDHYSANLILRTYLDSQS